MVTTHKGNKMTTSIVITAEHNAPVYGTEAAALAATGNKYGSGHGPRWAVWLTKDSELVELLQCGFPGLAQAREYASSIGKEIAALYGQKVVPV